MLFYDTYRANDFTEEQKSQGNGQSGSQQIAPVKAEKNNRMRAKKLLVDRIQPPLGVAFNRNDSNFYVVTPNELRIYCGATGRLIKIFSEVLDPRSSAELRTFSLDSRHRKLFCGDASGTVRSLNLSNGVPILTLTNRSNEMFDELRANNVTQGTNNEIVGIHVATGFSAETDQELSGTLGGDDEKRKGSMFM